MKNTKTHNDYLKEVLKDFTEIKVVIDKYNKEIEKYITVYASTKEMKGDEDTRNFDKELWSRCEMKFKQLSQYYDFEELPEHILTETMTELENLYDYIHILDIEKIVDGLYKINFATPYTNLGNKLFFDFILDLN